MELLRTYLIPKFIYGLQNPNLDRQTLTNADRLIRRFVRQTLHLHSHVENVLIHAPMKDGGLGIFSFRERIPLILERRINAILQWPELQFLRDSKVISDLQIKIGKMKCKPSSTKNSTYGKGLSQ